MEMKLKELIGALTKQTQFLEDNLAQHGNIKIAIEPNSLFTQADYYIITSLLGAKEGSVNTGSSIGGVTNSSAPFSGSNKKFICPYCNKEVEVNIT